MDLDRAHESKPFGIVGRRPDHPLLSAPGLSAPPGTDAGPLLPETTTPLLRRCTALAAKARVELLSQSRHDAADELVEVLEQIGDWSPERLVDPDPTMLVLCAASLQDLAERLPGAVTASLGEQVGTVLDLLHRVMAGERARASA